MPSKAVRLKFLPFQNEATDNFHFQQNKNNFPAEILKYPLLSL
jgi:hypothetical protein